MRKDMIFLENVVDKRFFEISELIIKDFQERNPIFYEENGVPVNYFYSILNEQISMFQEKGVVNFWCGYARDYLLSLTERGEIKVKNKGIFEVGGNNE